MRRAGSAVRSPAQKDDEDDDDKAGPNPEASTPEHVSTSHFTDGTLFADICCSDSATFTNIEEDLFGAGASSGQVVARTLLHR